MPARPCTPRDKATVETQVGVIQRQFFAEVRNETFASIAELNARFRAYLNRLNETKMKDHGVSRKERFQEEQSHLLPLPQTRFELAQYKLSSVHPDCHIQVIGNFYSVPFTLIGQKVRVKVTDSLIEVFHPLNHDSVAVHARVHGERRRFVTLDSHYPPHKVASARFDLELAKRNASQIGPETRALVEELFSGNFPLQYLRRVQGLLALKKRLSTEAIEYGVQQARHFNNTRLKYITACAERYSLRGTRLRIVTAPKRDRDHVHLHDPKLGEKSHES